MIPLAALVGVMFMVVIGTFAWNSLTILRRVPLTDAFVTVLVTIVTVLSDLAVAVVVGVIVSALAYAWNNARRIHAHEEINQDGSKSYRIQGPLFFGSSDGFVELFTPDEDPDTVVVDFADSRVVDQSALQAIEAVAAKYEGAGKRIQLRHLSRDCHRLLCPFCVKRGLYVDDAKRSGRGRRDQTLKADLWSSENYGETLFSLFYDECRKIDLTVTSSA